jgi:hypothetical protein
MYHKIIIPSSLHPDVIVGIFFLRKFGHERYPSIQNAKIEVRQVLPENETIQSLKEKGILVLDVGGGEFDHHQKGKILSELLAEDIGIIQDPAIAKLILYAKRDDQYGIGTISTDQIDRAFGLSGLISCLNKIERDPEKVMGILYPILNAHYTEERKRTTELPLEFEEKLKKGLVEIFEVKHKGKKIKVIFLESDNVSMAGWLKSSIGLKADVVCQKLNTGYVNILTKQSRMIDLRWLAAYLRNDELQLQERELAYSMEQLMRPGKIMEIPEWYYDRATNSLLNGGVNPKGILPTIIPADRIKQILKESLERDIPR